MFDVKELYKTRKFFDSPLFEDGIHFPRVFPTVSSHKIMDLCLLNQRSDFLDINTVKAHLFSEGRLSERQALKLIEDSELVLKREPNLLRIDQDVVIVGDIHGQFYDLIALLENFNIERDVLLFLGDYIDRGSFSTEVYLYLLLLKTHYPKNIYLLRGNHESRKTAEYFTFRMECRQKYSLDVYKKFLKSFNTLPLAAIILEKIYCAHGGISPKIFFIDEINSINRFSEIETKTTMCDILWADPHPEYGEDEPIAEFIPNTARRCSYYYTYSGVTKFLKRNKLLCVVRGHEVQQAGYKMYKSFHGVPSVITVFSAPNYCDSYKNLGAVLKFDGRMFKVRTFPAQPHPFCLPSGLDGVNWSYPFVTEKISEFYLDLLKEIDKFSENECSDAIKSEAISKMDQAQNFACSMAIIRSERENLCELDDEDSEMISAIYVQTSDFEHNEFEETRELDVQNEIVPSRMNLCGATIEIAPSLAPPITKNIENIGLDIVLRNSSIISLNDENALSIEIKERERKQSSSD